MSESLPLHMVTALDLTDGLGESAGRLLADLGATVIRIEPVGGSASRSSPPLIGDTGISRALNNANKQVASVDPHDPAAVQALQRLAFGADIIICSLSTAQTTALGLDPESLRTARPDLVWLSLSPFGSTGPYADWHADEAVLYAMSGVLSRSGVPGAAPLLPPSGLVEGAVGVHAVWAVLLAYQRRLRTGRGDRIELTAYEAVVHGFDPGFGTQGSAAAGRRDDYPRGRPDAAEFYPVFGCRDGQVRMCLLAPRQWQAMFAWLGEPAEFADPKYNTIPARFLAADRLHPLIGALFARYTKDQLIAEGAARGIPIGGLSALTDALKTPHFTESGALIDVELTPGSSARIPSGYAAFDGVRAGHRTPATGIDLVDAQWPRSEDDAPATPSAPDAPNTPPLAGVRVLDLGVIVFGAELSRQLADYGADVVKVENTTYPDGLRQAKRGTKISPSVVWGHRNKRSLGIDLRSDEGAELFRQLVREADVLTANFKPGTLDKMGFGRAELAALNPRLVVSESSAFGDHGPWRDRQGYGPLVRAAAGVSALWRYPDDSDGATNPVEAGASGTPAPLCDGSTVYPDHIAGHLAANLVVAGLIQRERTGAGTVISMAQSDVALTQVGVALAATSMGVDVGEYAPSSGVHPCAGEDEWCVVTVADDTRWAALCQIIGRPEMIDDPRLATATARAAHRDEVESIISDWTLTRSPIDAVDELQRAGIPAGPMVRLPELLTDPQLAERDSYTTITHPLLDGDLPATARAAAFTEIADPPARPAPLPGEHTREICAEWLGLAVETVEELIDRDVLQTAD